MSTRKPSGWCGRPRVGRSGACGIPRGRCAFAASIRLFLAVFVVTVSGPLLAQRVDLVPLGTSWRYFKGTTDAPGGWTTLGFEDTSWESGRTGIGYGDGDDVTLLTDMQGKYQTLYARRRFAVDDPGLVRELLLRIDYDDGFVAYVNGTEVARKGLGSAGTVVHHDTSATSHEYGVSELLDLAAALPLLDAGENILAFEVHNSSLSSDDLTFAPCLFALGPGPVPTRGPYLQALGGTSVLVVWETETAVVGSVEHGTTTALGEVVVEASAATLHAVSLTGLPPGAEHHYRILAGAEPASPIHAFRTAPAPEGARFRFVALGDSEKLNAGLLDAPGIVASLRPELAILMGDLIRDGDVDAYVFDRWAPVMAACPLYPALGNHDLDAVDDAYLRIFRPPTASSSTKRHYSFDHGNAHFVSLEVTDTDNYLRGSAQHDWLRADLAATDRLWKIVFFHEGPYSTGTTHGSNTTVRRELCPVFDEFGVDLVFSGHNHNYERTFPIRAGVAVDTSATAVYENPPGTLYVVTGGAGGSLYAQDSGASKALSALFVLRNHVCQVDIDGGVLVLRAVDTSGAVFDTVEIRKSTVAGPNIEGVRLDDVRGTSAVVEWATDRPSDSEVEVGPEGGATRLLGDDDLVTEHRVELPDLDPAKPHTVRVGSTDSGGLSSWSGPLSFHTMSLFLRGDANQDGSVDVADPVRLLLTLFTAASPSSCQDALDADDTGTVDITDAIAILNRLFLAAAPLPPPGPRPGDDPTDDTLGCEAYLAEG